MKNKTFISIKIAISVNVAIFSFFCSPGDGQFKETSLKEVVYLDQVHFRIPSNWTEHTDTKGGFYYDEKGEVVLKLNLITAVKEDDTIDFDHMIRDFQSSTLGRSSQVEILPSGNAFLGGSATSEDKKIIFWQIAHYFPPNAFEIAAFTLQISVSNEDETIIQLLRKEIRKTTFLKDEPSVSPKNTSKEKRSG